MKIALIGNMNNNFFATARMLWDRGYDAHVFVPDTTPEHFMPEADTFEPLDSKRVHFISWDHPFNIFKTPKEEIQQALAGFDFYIGHGCAPAYLQKAGITLDVFVPYGSDMYRYAYYKLTRPQNIIQYTYFAWLQRKGLRATKHLHLEPSHKLEVIAEDIGCKGEIHFLGCPSVYPAVPDSFGKSPFSQQVKALKEGTDLLIFHHSRHYWKTQGDPAANKGNDLFIRALSRFVKSHQDVSVKVVTFEYGDDVDASKSLIQEEGLAEIFHWFPKMHRRDIIAGLSLADLGAQQFRRPYLCFGTVLECLSVGVPVMYKRSVGESGHREEDLFEMYNVDSEETIYSALVEFSQDIEGNKARLGESGRNWFLKHNVNDPIDLYIRLAEQKVQQEKHESAR